MMFGGQAKKEMPPEDRAVTFFNMNDEMLVKYTGKLLEPPYSVPIQLVDTAKNSMGISRMIVEPSDRKYYSPYMGSLQGESKAAYMEAFALSRTVVISDSFFFDESMLHDTNSFQTNGGKEALVEFYNKGGTVMVWCEEGVYSIGSVLSQLFGCQWNLGGINNDNETCVPTEQGKALLGPDIAQNVFARGGHLMVVPDGEGLYCNETLGLEEYLTENYGIEIDNEEDDEELLDALRAYRRYKKNNSTSYLIAVHQNEQGGRLIWLGDRKQGDSKMRAIVAKLCYGS